MKNDIREMIDKVRNFNQKELTDFFTLIMPFID